MISLSAINIYPIKAVRGLGLESVMVEERGLAGDRRWLVVDADDRFISQREHAAMARLSANIMPKGLRLEAEGRTPLNVEFRSAPTRTVTIWRDEVKAIDAGDPAAEWLTEFIGFPARLVHMDEDSYRPVHPDYSEPGDVVSFADGFPLLIANEASLADLNARMETPLPMNRFRPNLVVMGAEPWAEDGWKVLRIGGVVFRNVKQCGRCLVTTTDQQTGERMGEEPLRTLSTFRKVDQAVMFGANLIPEREGLPMPISIGTAVEVLA